MFIIADKLRLSPEERLLIINITFHFFDIRFFELSVKNIAQNFCSTVNTVTSLLKKMNEADWIKIQKRQKIKGKDTSIYTFNKSFLNLVGEDEFLTKIANCNKDTIKKIITHGSVRRNNETEESLGLSYRSSNRLFLLILFIHANEFGVIKNLSATDICKLMGGISRDRFKSQLNHLYVIGAIKTHVPGVTGKRLFGKIKGTFYLNLEHSFFKNIARKPFSISIQLNFVLSGNELTQASHLFFAYKRIVRQNSSQMQSKVLETTNWHPAISSSIDKHHIKSVLPFFKNHALHDQFQSKLEQLSSLMLSNHFEDLVLPEKMNCLKEYLWLEMLPGTIRQSSELGDLSESVITNQILATEQSNESKDRFDTFNEEKKSFISLCRLMVNISYKMAKTYKALLTRLIANFEPCKLFSIPYGKFGQPRRIFEFLYDSKKQHTQSIKIIINAEKNNVDTDLSIEVIEGSDNNILKSRSLKVKDINQLLLL